MIKEDRLRERDDKKHSKDDKKHSSSKEKRRKSDTAGHQPTEQQEKSSKSKSKPDPCAVFSKAMQGGYKHEKHKKRVRAAKPPEKE